MPPIMLDMSLNIIEEEELENEEEEEDENELLLDMELEPIELEPMFMPPILDIILLIMSSMSPIFCICIPPCPPIKLGICIPPIPPIIGIGPPEDIMVEEEEEEEEDLKLEMVDP